MEEKKIELVELKQFSYSAAWLFFLRLLFTPGNWEPSCNRSNMSKVSGKRNF
jgi:hypothetical protein